MEKVPMTAARPRGAGIRAEAAPAGRAPAHHRRRSPRRARHGDLSENAEYHAAKEAQGLNEGRIAELEDQLSRAEVIDVSKLSGDTIKFGATVTLVDEDTEEEKIYQIVGDVEADVKDGPISISSPIARALIGKEVGDTVEVNTPRRRQVLRDPRHRLPLTQSVILGPWPAYDASSLQLAERPPSTALMMPSTATLAEDEAHHPADDARPGIADDRDDARRAEQQRRAASRG